MRMRRKEKAKGRGGREGGDRRGRLWGGGREGGRQEVRRESFKLFTLAHAPQA